MKGIYLLLGSNLGDRFRMLEKARSHIVNEIGDLQLASSIYSTKAWGIEDQPDFLNQVLKVRSTLAPEELLQKVNLIEERLGRVRRIKWHSRLIDIDILYYGNRVINSARLTIPHPENENRRFVLAPMVEIAADFVHPVLNLSHRDLLALCEDPLPVERVKKSRP